MHIPGQFCVLTPLAFLEDVKREAKAAKKRVWAQAMDVEPGEYTDILTDALHHAAKRDLDVRFHIDYYSFLVTDGIFNYWPFVSSSFRQQRRKRLKRKYAIARTLREDGAQVLFTNRPTLLDRFLPTRGRNHMKMVIIDSTAWIGGVNFHDQNFLASDVMIKITDPAMTEELAYVFALVSKQESLRDMSISLSDDTTLLVDGGRINHSIILRRAITLVNQAQTSIQVVSPLLPDASFLTALTHAVKRNINVEVIAPKIETIDGILGLVDAWNLVMLRLKRSHLPIRFNTRKIHAKVLIVDNKEIIVGSHNFSSRGVRMGTEEIALQSSNKTLVNNVIDYYYELAKSTEA